MNIASISMDVLMSESYSEDAPIELLADAEIILGQDDETNKLFIVEEKEKLSVVVQDNSHNPVNVLVVKLNRYSDQLRRLHWLIDVAKSC